MLYRRIILLIPLIIILGFLLTLLPKKTEEKVSEDAPQSHWFILHRQSQREELFYGIPGDKEKSKLLRTFVVKTGIPGERPTPLPQLVGREYWRVIDKAPSTDNPETSPYFITLDVPVGEEEPFGPEPYRECKDPVTGEDVQCNWILPGAFGLHGIASDEARLSPENPGSSGCIRHSDEDITYLYNVLDPKKEEIRYYIEDN